MPRKTWNVGDVLTSDDMNTYVRDQTIIRCTSTSHPTLGLSDNGQHIYETDSGRTLKWVGTGYVALAPAPGSIGYRAIIGNDYNGAADLDNRVGTTVATVAAGGAVQFSWGNVAHGVLTFVVSPGDNVGNFSQVIPILQNMQSMNVFNGVAYQPNGTVVATGQQIRVNYNMWCW